MKHTSGPWESDFPFIVSQNKKHRDIYIAEVVVSDEEGRFVENPDSQIANGHLIAAAPLLLTMLQRMIDETFGGATPCLLTHEQARNAVAKATGAKPQ